MDSLRDQIAALIEPFLAEDDWADDEADKVADAILQIPEIKEALELAEHWSKGVELPPELIEKMGRVYGSNPATIRVTDD